MTMKFKSNPTTNEAQSFMLCNAGLNPETADCYIEEDGHVVIARDEYDLDIALNLRRLSPAWSLSRLLDILPDEIYVNDKDYKRTLNGDFFTYSHYINGEWMGDLKMFRIHGLLMSGTITMLISMISEGKYIDNSYLIKRKVK